MPVIPELGVEAERPEFESSLSHTVRPCLKKTKTKTKFYPLGLTKQVFLI
jgi:hypothetical protein